MVHKLCSTLPAIAAAFFACTTGNLEADNNSPPAGQMCPQGAYVIGFDSGGNIVCSGAAANSAAAHDAPPRADDKGDGNCPAECLSGMQESSAASGGAAAETASAERAAGTGVDAPVISSIKPAWVVFGARETTIKIGGAGFTAGSTVKFRGQVYTPSVNADGTELRVTIATADLAMGRYPITVSNGAGVETTRKRALEVF